MNFSGTFLARSHSTVYKTSKWLIITHNKSLFWHHVGYHIFNRQNHKVKTYTPDWRGLTFKGEMLPKGIFLKSLIHEIIKAFWHFQFVPIRSVMRPHKFSPHSYAKSMTFWGLLFDFSQPCNIIDWLATFIRNASCGHEDAGLCFFPSDWFSCFPANKRCQKRAVLFR